MSMMGMWVMGAVADEQIHDALCAAVQTPSPTPAHADASRELAWWRDEAPGSLFRPSTAVAGEWQAGDDAFRLSDFLDTCRDDSDQVEALRDALMDHFPTEGEGLFIATARKASPFSALAYALGPDAVIRLPGWLGDFLLKSDEVRAALPAAEEALALDGARRRQAVERIHAWMTGLGDAPDHDADGLLDGPLRVLRHAARTGQGAAGHVRWY